MKKMLFLFTWLFAIHCIAQDIWVQKADFGGTAKTYATGFSIGTKGYIGTGYLNGTATKDFWEYNPAANTWTQKADFGGSVRYGAVGFSVASKGYVGTGYNGGDMYKDFWEYDPSVNTWAKKADFGGTERYLATGFSIGTKGYLGTGYNSGFFKDFWEYNPLTDAWSRKTDFGGMARYGATGFSIGTKGYLGTGNSSGLFKDFWEYDALTNAWSQKTDFGGTARYFAVSFSIGTKGYIGTGGYKDLWEFDQSVNTWTKKTDFGGTARYGATAFSIGNKGYVGTGGAQKDFWEYSPTVEAPKLSTNANLSGLSISAGAITPVFDSATTSYTISVPDTAASTTVTPVVADTTATVAINGATVVSGNTSAPIVLNTGLNTITVIVTAQDTTVQKKYTITVTKAVSVNADLSALVTSAGTLSPEFSDSTTYYTTLVANSVTSLTVTAATASTTATTTVNGVTVSSGSASQAIALNVGTNTITIVVTAQDGITQKTYVITVIRPKSSNADLSSLLTSTGTLSLLGGSTTSYTLSVGNSVTSITVKPVTADSTATVMVNEVMVNSGSASKAIKLKVGVNQISIVVTAQDGVTQKTYIIAATRAIKIPSVPNLTKGTDLGISNSDDITNVTAPDFVGTADSGATVILYDSTAEIGSGIADSLGNWKITSSKLDTGVHSIKSKALLNGLTSTISKGLYVTIDTKAPIVSTISRLNPDSAITNATVVTYRIIFAESISGITVNALKLTLSGMVAGTIASVSSDTGAIIDVAINKISGEGNLRLDVKDSSSIMDIAGNLMSTGYASGQVYTIVQSTLPVTLAAFNAYRKESTVEVTWKAIGEINVDKYVIERKSNDGTTYIEVGEMMAKGNSSTDVVYTWTDTQPLSGNNFYRLKTIDKDGTVKYSDIKAVNFSFSGQYLKIVPNPVVNKTIRYTLVNAAAGKYEANLYDNNGRSVFRGTIVHDGGNAIKTIHINSLSATGMCHLSFTSSTLKLNEAVMIK